MNGINFVFQGFKYSQGIGRLMFVQMRSIGCAVALLKKDMI